MTVSTVKDSLHLNSLHLNFLRLNRAVISIIGWLFVGSSLQAQPVLMEEELRQNLAQVIDLNNPEFLKEFYGSFEVGLTPGAPAMSTRDQVIISVALGKSAESMQAALDFILADVATAKNADSEYSSSANVDYAIGELYQFQNKPQSAEKYYLQAIQKYPSYVTAYTRLMELSLSQENCDKAVAMGKKALEIGGASGFLFRGFGYCYLLDEDDSAALNAFRMAKSFSPDDSNDDYYYAVAALNIRAYDEAIAVLDELMAKSPGEVKFYTLLVNAYLAKGDIDQALQNLEIARRRDLLKPANYTLLGNIYVQKKMAEAASAAYITTLDGDNLPSFSIAAQNFRYLTRLEDWISTQNYHAKIVNVYGDQLWGEDLTDLKVMQARVLIGLEKPTEAASLLREVVDADPTNGYALISLANHYRQQRDYERANLHFQWAAREPEVALQALTANAEMLAEQEDWQPAIDLLVKARDMAPTATRQIIERNIRAIERALNVTELL